MNYQIIHGMKLLIWKGSDYMATTTTNYKLTKPNGTDKAYVSVINDNMDLIDSAIKDVESKITTSTINSIATQDIQNLFI